MSVNAVGAIGSGDDKPQGTLLKPQKKFLEELSGQLSGTPNYVAYTPGQLIFGDRDTGQAGQAASQV